MPDPTHSGIDTIDKIKKNLTDREDALLERMIEVYRENFKRLVKPDSLEFESPTAFADALGKKFCVEIEFGDPINKMDHKDPPQWTEEDDYVRELEHAQTLLEKLEGVIPEAGNWMALDNYIEGWHVGNQGAPPSCNGWAIADGCLTLLYAIYEEEKRRRNDRSASGVEPIRIDSDKSGLTIDRDAFLPSVRYVWMIGKLNPREFNVWDIVNDSAGANLVRTAKHFISSRELATRDQMPYHCVSPFPIETWDQQDIEILLKPDLEKNFFRNEAKPLAYRLYDTTLIGTTLLSEAKSTLIPLLVEWLTKVGPVAWEFSKPKFLSSHPDCTTLSLEASVLDFSKGTDGTFHTATLVGFEKVPNTRQPEYRFIVRNSYGVRWGYFGQAYVSQEDLEIHTSGLVGFSVNPGHFVQKNF